MTHERSTHYLADAIDATTYADRRLRIMNNRPMGDFTDDDVRLLRADLLRALHSVDAWDALRRSVNACALPPGTALTAGFCTSDGTGTVGCV